MEYKVFDILNDICEHFTLVQLVYKVGNINHAAKYCCKLDDLFKLWQSTSKRKIIIWSYVLLLILWLHVCPIWNSVLCSPVYGHQNQSEAYLRCCEFLGHFYIDVCMYYIFINMANVEQVKLTNKQRRPLILKCSILLLFSSYYNNKVDLGNKSFSEYIHKT